MTSRDGSLVSVCVFCGSSRRVPERHLAAARALGAGLAARGWRLVFGGGAFGMMGACADGALAGRGPVTGVMTRALMDDERPHRGVSDTRVVSSMHERKRVMATESDAFVVLPGGLGTLEEAFEITTWKQLDLHGKPVLWVNLDGFFDRLLDHLRAASELGFIRPEHLALVRPLPDVAAALTALDALALAPTRRPRTIRRA